MLVFHHISYIKTIVNYCHTSFHLKRWMKFPKRENQTFYYCIQKSTDVRKLITKSLNPLASATTHSFRTWKGREITDDWDRRKWKSLKETQNPTWKKRHLRSLENSLASDVIAWTYWQFTARGASLTSSKCCCQ